MYGIPATRSAAYRYRARLIYVPLAAASLLLSATARAVTPACSPTDTTFACRLTGLLTWLQAAAVILAVVLVVVIGVTVHLIRKNQAARRNRR